MLSESVIGLQTKAKNSGAMVGIRSEQSGAIVTSDAHGRFQEAAVQGVLFSGGMTLTAIVAATFTTATLGATATPIVGVYNPIGSGKNLIILQAKLQAVLTALQATGAGAYMWASSIGNIAITTGVAPFNRGTGAASGSVARDVSGVALTGLTNNLVVRDASALQGGSIYNASLLGTAAGFMTVPVASVDNVDGSIIVPPGGVLALLCTTTPVAVSAASSIMWEEVPA